VDGFKIKPIEQGMGHQTCLSIAQNGAIEALEHATQNVLCHGMERVHLDAAHQHAS
jgi:hypothetical protein